MHVVLSARRGSGLWDLRKHDPAVRRTLRNTTSLLPFLIGAVAGAEVNRRATAGLGDAVVRDLADTRPWR